MRGGRGCNTRFLRVRGPYNIGFRVREVGNTLSTCIAFTGPAFSFNQKLESLQAAAAMTALKTTLAVWLLCASFALAANKYVTPGGSGSGASWSSPASPAIINSSGSGDVIYMAGGSYGNGIRVDASSVTIKRATAADHGSDTGWQASMDKQATFDSGWLVSGSNVTIDGNCWKPPGLPTVFGFKIKHASGAKGIDAGGSAGRNKFINLEIPGPGINSSRAEADGIHFGSDSSISGCAIYDTDALIFAWKGTSNVVIENSYLYNASSNIVISGNPQDPHPDVIYSGGMFTNGTMRWCLVANVTSEGVFFDQELPGDNMVFYGNIMFQGDAQQPGNTPIQFQNGAHFGKVLTYHNTFVDFNKSNIIGPGTTLGSGSAVVNNIFCNYLPNWPTGVNNNGFTGGSGIGTNQILNSASPFVTSGKYVWVKGSGNTPSHTGHQRCAGRIQPFWHGGGLRPGGQFLGQRKRDRGPYWDERRHVWQQRKQPRRAPGLRRQQPWPNSHPCTFGHTYTGPYGLAYATGSQIPAG